VKEAIPSNAPEARGKSVTTSCFCDASHASDQMTRRIWTGIVIFVNRAPILWISKAQPRVESSTYSSEIVAARIAVETVEGLHYKLRMMGIPIDGPTNMFCDNQGVVKNVTCPESVLKKKHASISWHRLREAQASMTVRVCWESTDSNLSDLFTKLLNGPRLKELVSRVLW